MTSKTTAKTVPVDLRLLLRATPVDLRKPILAWAASTQVGEPSNYGLVKYLIFICTCTGPSPMHDVSFDDPARA
jgi:hypothetical protein